MNAFLLLCLVCTAWTFPPVLTDDSAETTTATGDTTVSSGPIDFDAFDADLDEVYKSIAKIKSKASKLELIGPKIQSAMLHLAGDEGDVAKNLQAKYAQILPILQKLKIDDTITQTSVDAGNRRRRDVSTSDADASGITIADAGVTEPTNTVNTASPDETVSNSTSAAVASSTSPSA